MIRCGSICKYNCDYVYVVHDAALTAPGGDSHAPGVTLGSDQMRGRRGHLLNMK